MMSGESLSWPPERLESSEKSDAVFDRINAYLDSFGPAP